MQRICDNSQGVINFCLFCLFTKEVRSAAVNAIKQLCHCQSASRITVMPDFSWATPDTSNTGSTYDYGALSSQEVASRIVFSINFIIISVTINKHYQL